jgi:hypothetical protein
MINIVLILIILLLPFLVDRLRTSQCHPYGSWLGRIYELLLYASVPTVSTVHLALTSRGHFVLIKCIHFLAQRRGIKLHMQSRYSLQRARVSFIPS